MAPTREGTTTAPPDAWRVEVFRRPEHDDPGGAEARSALEEAGLPVPDRVRTGHGYMLSPHYGRDEVERIAREVLVDPVLNEVEITAPGAPLEAGVGHRIRVLPRPGVMDPVALTLEELFERAGMAPGEGAPGVATYRLIELHGSLATGALEEAGRRIFANETIEVVSIDSDDLPYGKAHQVRPRGRVEVALLEVGDEALETMSREGQLSLTLLEMQTIQAHFKELGREPTACEIETIAQTWSEHCKHKTFAGIINFTGPDGQTRRIDNLLKSTIAKATHELDRDFCVSVFVDNAGIIAFEEGWDLAIKVETHNHPSAIDPYGGAGTGIGGVIRDLLGVGLGSKPIANIDAFFVGPMDLPASAVPDGSKHPRRILRGVVAGVRDYGNRMGIPTVAGGVWFDERYVGNPLVYAGTVGLMPRSAAEKEVLPGDLVVAFGGRTGRDGIHGATFSSIELSEESETDSNASVQIGDPITEKRVLDVLLQARDQGLYRSITDCGAGGFSSAVGEMGEKVGVDVELDSVPLKYAGLSSHEIWISEAQERMVVAVPPEKLDAFLAVMQAEDVEATVIGRFTGDGILIVRDQGETVAEISMSFLHDGTPRPTRAARWQAPDLEDPGCPQAKDAGAAVLALLASPNIASKEWIVRQYDHEVQGNTVLKPLVGVHGDGPGDAAIVQPLPAIPSGAAIGCGASPTYGDLDPYAMATSAIDEAMRNVVAVGADPNHAAILDNFSWGNCDRPEQLGALVLASDACYDAAMAYRTPFISGKDSLNNEYRVGGRTLSIPPTLLITALAKVPHLERSISMDLKTAESRIYLVGRTRPELGGSHWHLACGVRGGRVPRPDLEEAPGLMRAMHAAIRAGSVHACHDLSEGGLATAAAEMAFAGELGLDLDLAQIPIEGELPANYDADATRLFSESCTRFLVEVPDSEAGAFERHLDGFPIQEIGRVKSDPRLTVQGSGGQPLMDETTDKLRSAFTGGFQG